MVQTIVRIEEAPQRGENGLRKNSLEKIKIKMSSFCKVSRNQLVVGNVQFLIFSESTIISEIFIYIFVTIYLLTIVEQ